MQGRACTPPRRCLAPLPSGTRRLPTRRRPRDEALLGQHSKLELRGGIALFRRQTEPLDRFGDVPRHSVAREVQLPKRVLSAHVALFRSGADPLHSLRRIRRHPEPAW